MINLSIWFKSEYPFLYSEIVIFFQSMRVPGTNHVFCLIFPFLFFFFISGWAASLHNVLRHILKLLWLKLQQLMLHWKLLQLSLPIAPCHLFICHQKFWILSYTYWLKKHIRPGYLQHCQYNIFLLYFLHCIFIWEPFVLITFGEFFDTTVWSIDCLQCIVPNIIYFRFFLRKNKNLLQQLQLILLA